LGALIIAALVDFRQSCDIDFSITGLTRHQSLADLCTNLGADEIIEVDSQSLSGLKKKFDIVYDSSGTTDGFMTSLDLAKRVVHVKSTNGQPVLGLDYLTEMVVDEIALLPFSTGNLLFSWFNKVQSGEVRNIFVSHSIGDDLLAEIEILRPKAKIIRAGFQDVIEELTFSASNGLNGSFNQFDTAVVGDLYEVNQVLRPDPGKAEALIRPRGTVLLAGNSTHSGHKLENAISGNNLEIHTSRCGDFNAALQILKNSSALISTLQKQFITHHFPLEQLQQAFEVATDSGTSIKVMVDI
jgi:threonine dehydrogenase-like Zn-dependent dehydrogenase